GARVGLGPAESGREEPGLFTFETIHIGSSEEARELIIGKHANVEVLYHDFDGLLPADPVVDRGRLGFAGSRQLVSDHARITLCNKRIALRWPQLYPPCETRYRFTYRQSAPGGRPR